MLRSLAGHVTRECDPLKAGFSDFLQYNQCQLQDAKLVTFNDDGHHFINLTRLSMLHTGALWQLSERIQTLETQLALQGGK